MNPKIKKWLDKNIKESLKDKNIFITGANSGVGLETARNCLYLKANVFLICRNLERANKAKEELLNEFPDSKIEILIMDQASLSSINSFVNSIKERNLRIDGFINNAGVFKLPQGQTKDGYEIVLGTNFINVYFLNKKLVDYLKDKEYKTKIIFTTSITAKMCKIDYDDFFSTKKYKPMEVYARSKASIVDLYNYFLDLNISNISFSLTHPGGTYSPLIEKGYKNKLFKHAAKDFMLLVFHHTDKASLSNIEALFCKDNSCFGPRGFVEISGYPKKTKFKKNKDYKKTIDIAEKTLKEAGYGR